MGARSPGPRPPEGREPPRSACVFSQHSLCLRSAVQPPGSPHQTQTLHLLRSRQDAQHASAVSCMQRRPAVAARYHDQHFLNGRSWIC